MVLGFCCLVGAGPINDHLVQIAHPEEILFTLAESFVKHLFAPVDVGGQPNHADLHEVMLPVTIWNVQALRDNFSSWINTRETHSGGRRRTTSPVRYS